MADIRPFRAYRPARGLEAEVAALPYDVFTREEAKAYVQSHQHSFLRIDRPESQFPDDVSTYDPRVYEKAREMLDQDIAEGIFVQDSAPCYYIYEQTWRGRSQTGIVGCASIDDYLHNVIRKHENTVAAKEEDRIRHVDACSAQTGPIFLAYRNHAEIDQVTAAVTAKEPVCDFVSDGEVRNRVWVVSDQDSIRTIRSAFDGIGKIYIADGHHRAASAVKVGLKRRKEHPDYDGTEEFNTFLCVLFPEKELKILDYNRVVKGVFSGKAISSGTTASVGTTAFTGTSVRRDHPALSKGEVLAGLRPSFTIVPYRKAVAKPASRGEIGMYMEGNWYLLTARNNVRSGDAVKGLDVSILQYRVLAPLFGISDPRTDPSIEFVGGIRGTDELMRRADEESGIAFLMYPTSIQELFRVADAGRLMPPKSTWFEPKLLSGLFIHRI